MIGLIIDTESWIRNYRGAISHDIRGQEGDTALDSLAQILERGNVRIVLPTVVIDEWHRHKADPKSNIADTVNRAVAIARSLPNYLSEDAGRMLSFLLEADRFDKERVFEVVDRRVRIVEDLFNHSSTVRVDAGVTAEHQAVEAALHEKAPFQKRNSMADALILFSALEHVRSADYERSLFVSNNNDFADEKDPTKLHPDLVPLFREHRVEYVPLLASALNEIPDSNIDEEVIAEAEREEVRERLLEQPWLWDAGPFYQISDLQRISQPYTALQDAISVLSVQQSESVRRMAEALQPSSAVQDAINAITERDRETMRGISERLQLESQLYLETHTAAPRRQHEYTSDEEE